MFLRANTAFWNAICCFTTASDGCGHFGTFTDYTVAHSTSQWARSTEHRAYTQHSRPETIAVAILIFSFHSVFCCCYCCRMVDVIIIICFMLSCESSKRVDRKDFGFWFLVICVAFWKWRANGHSVHSTIPAKNHVRCWCKRCDIVPSLRLIHNYQK